MFATAVFLSSLYELPSIERLICSAVDVAFKDGKIGDYLFLGNMVYTVSVFSC